MMKIICVKSPVFWQELWHSNGRYVTPVTHITTSQATIGLIEDLAPALCPRLETSQTSVSSWFNNSVILKLASQTRVVGWFDNSVLKSWWWQDNMEEFYNEV